MAKISASTFVVGYSVILLILFVTFSILMSKVNPNRIYFDDEAAPEPKVVHDDSKEHGEDVPVNPKPDDLMIYAHRRTYDNDTFIDYVKNKNTDNMAKFGTKEILAKERRSLRDPSTALDHLGIVILEVTDEEGLPRIEIMFHPKRSLIKRINKNKGDINMKKSFRAYDKAETRKGLISELTDNSVIKIMPDNTILLENSNILVSEENVTNSSSDVSSTNDEIGLVASGTLDPVNNTVDSGFVVVKDTNQSETTTPQYNVTLKIIDEKQFEDTETVETTTDETVERTTYINAVFESVDITSKTSYLPETINLDAFENNGSIITTYSYTLDTTNTSENHNNTEATDAYYFDMNDTMTTELFTEPDTNSFIQTINKLSPKDKYATGTKDDPSYGAINSKNSPAEAINYEVSATKDRNETLDGTIYKVTDIFGTTEKNLALETKDELGDKTFDTYDKIDTVYATDKVIDVMKTTTDANILKAIVERVENILKAETSDVTDLLLQNTETSIIRRENEITDVKNPLKVLPVFNNATKSVGNTVDNTTNTHVTAESVPNTFEGYLAAAETIFNNV